MQDNRFANPAPAIKDNPFGDPVESGPIPGIEQTDDPFSMSDGIVSENGDHQTGTGFDLPVSNLDQETTAVVGKEPAPSAASGFDWVNPVYLLAMVRPIVPLASFVINQDYIAKFFCVNQDKPELDCNGKCYLMQKLEEQNEEKR